MSSDKLAIRIGPVSPAIGGPLYQQIIGGIKREISEGRLTANTPLPSFRILAEQLLVSVITVKRAYEELEREGIIYRRQGLGTFVAEQGLDRSRQSNREHAAELIRQALREARESGLSPTQAKQFVTQVVNQFINES